MMNPKKRPLTKREIVLIVIIFTALFYFAGWQITGKYLFDDFINTRSNINSLREEQAILLSLAEEADMLKEQISKDKDQHKELKRALPDLDLLPMVLNDLESFLTEKPVTINSMRIGDTVYLDHHAAVTMQLKASAAPHHLLSFLKQLEMLPNKIHFDYLTWNNQSGPGIEMELKLQLLFYHPDYTQKHQGRMF